MLLPVSPRPQCHPSEFKISAFRFLATVEILCNRTFMFWVYQHLRGSFDILLWKFEGFGHFQCCPYVHIFCFLYLLRHSTPNVYLNAFTHSPFSICLLTFRHCLWNSHSTVHLDLFVSLPSAPDFCCIYFYVVKLYNIYILFCHYNCLFSSTVYTGEF